MFSIYYMLENRSENMTETLTGWEKHNFALINPETMAQLEIVARTPAIITAENICNKVVTLWPSNDVCF